MKSSGAGLNGKLVQVLDDEALALMDAPTRKKRKKKG